MTFALILEPNVFNYCCDSNNALSAALRSVNGP